MMAKIETPYDAPEFSLSDASGKIYTLKDFAGSWLVLYFYPKDDTPGCTTQACSLRDARDDLTDLGAKVVGISMDDASSHEKFKEKHNLNFTLLSDPEAVTINTYGAWGPKMFGREGILRKTFIIDPHGTVQKVYGRANPIGHGESVVEVLKKLQNS
jgi:thioredoxin-dependent peroxiredoxin